MGGSLYSLVFVVLLVGGMGGYYYFVVWKKHMSPEARKKAFAAAGMHPGEDIATSFVGFQMTPEPNGDLSVAAVSVWAMAHNNVSNLPAGAVTPNMVSGSVTTFGRLVVNVGGTNVIFEANQKPAIRIIGHIVTVDKTGIADQMLWNQTKTAVSFVPLGQQPPPNATRRMTHTTAFQQEMTSVVEVTSPGRAPLLMDIADSAANALIQWSQMPAQQMAPPPPQPYGMPPNAPPRM